MHISARSLYLSMPCLQFKVAAAYRKFPERAMARKIKERASVQRER